MALQYGAGSGLIGLKERLVEVMAREGAPAEAEGVLITAGAQQALMVYAFRDIAPRSTVLAYSVGQQVAIAVFNVATAMVALFLMVRTFDIRSVVRRGEEDRRASEAAEKTEPTRSGPS